MFLVHATTHPKFDPTKGWTHNLQIMDSTFHVPEIFVLTTSAQVIIELSGHQYWWLAGGCDLDIGHF